MSEPADQGLLLSGVTVERNGFPVVRNLDLRAPLGSVTVLLGPNGAGKTTVLEAISGVIPVAAGSISFAGRPLVKPRPRTPVKNSRSATLNRAATSSPTSAWPRTSRSRSGRSWSLDDAYSLFPELRSRHDVAAGMLSGEGNFGVDRPCSRRRANDAAPRRALPRPRADNRTPADHDNSQACRRAGVGALLVEQFASLLSINGWAYVLRDGGCIYEGPCRDVESDVLLGAYLAASRARV